MKTYILLTIITLVSFYIGWILSKEYYQTDKQADRQIKCEWITIDTQNQSDTVLYLNMKDKPYLYRSYKIRVEGTNPDKINIVWSTFDNKIWCADTLK